MNNPSQALKNKRFFVWDFDGCFCDTEYLHFVAYKKAFQEAGHEIHEHSYYPSFTHLGGGTEREIAEHGLTVAPEQIAASKKKFYWEEIRASSPCRFPEMNEIANAIKARGGRIAIASNSPVDEIRFILEKAEMLDIPELIVGLTPGLRKKPAPDLFLKAMNELGASPDETIIFEDTHRGLQAAAAAGCQAIWTRTRFNDTLTTDQPYLAAVTHAELLQLLKG